MAKVIVYHGGYGCQTGCCAHWVEFTDDADQVREKSFLVEHPQDETPQQFAQRLITRAFGAEHVADLDWENSRVMTDDECDMFA